MVTLGMTGWPGGASTLNFFYSNIIRHPDMGRRIVRVMEKMRGITSVSLEVGNLTEVELMENVRNNHTVPPDVMSLMQPGTQIR